MLSLEGFLSFALVLITTYSQPSEDLIQNLPGQTWNPNYKQYSGYLDIPQNGHHYFYWFVESQSNPSTDPIVLWLQGGPGCSSLMGLFYEHGPFHVHNTDQQPNLYNNQHASWNNNASVLYIESPICTGYSYSDNGECIMNDNTTTSDNYQALLQFFTKFPIYQSNNFFLSGESYAGIYIPVLAYTILRQNKNKPTIKLNLKGFTVGGPMGCGDDWHDSIIWYNYFHGFIGSSRWKKLLTECCISQPYTRQHCKFSKPPNAQCAELVAQSGLNWMINKGLNEYDWAVDCYPDGNVTENRFDEYKRSIKYLIQYLSVYNPFIKDVIYNDKDEVAVSCMNTHGAYKYMNLNSVQDAIHIKNKSIEWNIVSDSLHYTSLPMYYDLSYMYMDMLNMDDELYIMVYTGDVDTGGIVLGAQWFVDDLNLPKLANYSWREWYYDDLNTGKQVGGWTKNFERLSFVTIRGSGHMVPQFTPMPALKIFNYFIQNKPLE